MVQSERKRDSRKYVAEDAQIYEDAGEKMSEEEWAADHTSYQIMGKVYRLASLTEDL